MWIMRICQYYHNLLSFPLLFMHSLHIQAALTAELNREKMNENPKKKKKIIKNSKCMAATSVEKWFHVRERINSLLFCCRFSIIPNIQLPLNANTDAMYKREHLIVFERQHFGMNEYVFAECVLLFGFRFSFHTCFKLENWRCFTIYACTVYYTLYTHTNSTKSHIQ